MIVNNAMYAVTNSNNLYVMQIDYKQYAFTDNVDLAIKFITKEGADLFIRKNILLGHLKTVKL